MPRVIIEYTNKLIEHNAFDPAQLIAQINQTLMDSGQFHDEGIKSIAFGSNLYARSTQPQGCEFICVTAYILSGRSTELKQEISNNLLQVLQTQVKKVTGIKTQISASVEDTDRQTFTETIIG